MTVVRSGPGRRRDPDLEERVYEVALRLYLRDGVAGFNFDRVAREASVGKAALYRRWQGRDELLLDVLDRYTPAQTIPDTGSLRTDLSKLAGLMLDEYALGSGLVQYRVYLDAEAYPDLLAEFHRRTSNRRISGARAMVHRAVDRGELPAEVPIALFLDMFAGTLQNWFMSGEANGDRDAFVAELVDALFRAFGN